jgi:uncharacterized membrane protein
MEKDKELQSINERIETLVNAENMQKHDMKRPFRDLPDMPFASYKELKEEIEKKNASLSVEYLRMSSTGIEVVFRKNESRMFNAALYAPFLIALMMVGLAILLKDYFLLIALLWLPVANWLSSVYINPPLYPFRGSSIAYLALIVGGISLFVSHFTVSLLAFGYAFMHLSYAFTRRVYGKVLAKRALESELIFRFLYVGGYLSVLRNV